jgi:hypothetical protein
VPLLRALRAATLPPRVAMNLRRPMDVVIGPSSAIIAAAILIARRVPAICEKTSQLAIAASGPSPCLLLSHLGDGGRLSWRPVVGVVLPPLWHKATRGSLCPGLPRGPMTPGPRQRASSGRTDGLRTSHVGRAGVVGASDMATDVVVGSAVILAPVSSPPVAPPSIECLESEGRRQTPHRP